MCHLTHCFKYDFRALRVRKPQVRVALALFGRFGKFSSRRGGSPIGHEKSCMTALKIVYVVYQNRVRGLFFRPPLNFEKSLDQSDPQSIFKNFLSFSQQCMIWLSLKKNEKLIARVKMSCYTLFGVFHGHRPAVYINQHLLWALMSVTSGTLTQTFGSSRIASPAFFYFFANRQLPSAKCDVRCDAIARACE